ncbi:MAG: glycosyltransferase family 4 protein [Pseudomonadota bacterium]
MFVDSLAVGVIAWLVSFALTGVVQRQALRARLLDIPNARSSHALPTPRGGGIAIAIVVCAGLAILAALGRVTSTTVLAIVPATLAVAIAGLVDDRRGLSARIRLVIHFAAAALYIGTIGGPPALGIAWLDGLPWLPSAVTLLGLVWLLNLFNFMDGIDGIAGAELVFVSFALALVTQLSSGPPASPLFAVLLGAAGAGFLGWNWPPAKIFMGDVGSGFVGLALGALSLQTMQECGIAMWVPLILLASFTTDATVTLLRRVVRGETWHAAHRTHAYQWLSRRWGSHRKVVLALLASNLLWLLPLALLALRFPRHGGSIAALAHLPLVVLACWSGAGRRE